MNPVDLELIKRNPLGKRPDVTTEKRSSPYGRGFCPTSILFSAIEKRIPTRPVVLVMALEVTWPDATL